MTMKTRAEENRKLLKSIDEPLSDDAKPEMVHEKIQDGETDFLPAWFLEKGAETAKTICRLRFSDDEGRYYGTGFMLTSNLMMTNNHVFPTPEVAQTGIAEFNYQKAPDGTLMHTDRYSIEPDLFFITSEALDFTIVAVDGKPGNRYGSIPLLRNWQKVGRGDRVHIIQHPAGNPKQVVLYSNKVTNFTRATLHYKADTLGGSSGSPVFNNLWQLVALHQVGSSDFNEGIRISAILRYLGLLNSHEKTAPMLAELLNHVPDTNEFGFFDLEGIAPEKLEQPEKVALTYKGTADYLDIGFWNIENFNRNARPRRISAVADLIENLRLDLFGLSEVSAEAMDKLTKALNSRGLHYAFDLENVRGGQDLAILYDTEVVEIAPYPFTAGQQEIMKEKIRGKNVFPRLPMQRKVTVTRGDHSRSFLMLVLHLKAFGDQLSKERRRRAAEILRQIIDGHIQEAFADIILGGDMNEVLDQGDFDALTSGDGLIALTADDASQGGDAVSWIGSRNKSLIDHIFVSNDAFKTTVADSITITRLDKSIPHFDDVLSDHIPVIFRALFGKEAVIGPITGTEIVIDRHVNKLVIS